MCLLGSTVNWAARLMAKAGPGVVLVDAETQVAQSMWVQIKM